ncbi:MAG: ATP-binding protein [Spirochaetales bacterium]|nr:ATP-binding protein [Spirochaetales bacterium]
MDYAHFSREELLAQLEKSEKRNQSLIGLLTHLNEGIIVANKEDKLTFLNKSALEITGWKAEEALGQSFEKVVNLVDHFTSRSLNKDIKSLMSTEWGNEENSFLDIISKDGLATQVRLNIIPLKEECCDGAVMITIKDITETHHIREELTRIQKLNALGQMAGSVAHSFNNMLTGILGFSELISEEVKGDSSLEIYNKEIIDTCLRASGVTGDLLNFSRQQKLGRVTVDMNQQIREASEQLKMILGSKINLIIQLNAPKSTVLADPFQVSELIMNLGRNSRDVLNDEGTITVSTTNRFYSLEECRKKSRLMEEGEYLLLKVTDTGPGISEEALPHIFDPFYTTKESNRSGMGLSSVYGTVISHGGHIRVDTKQGEGTSFEIALPLVNMKTESPA